MQRTRFMSSASGGHPVNRVVALVTFPTPLFALNTSRNTFSGDTSIGVNTWCAVPAICPFRSSRRGSPVFNEQLGVQVCEQTGVPRPVYLREHLLSASRSHAWHRLLAVF
jgi:hypothetical protein